MFPSDTYKTDPNTAKSCLAGTWLVFAINFVRALLSARGKARTGNYSSKDWESSSYRSFNILENAGARITISGLDNIRNTEGPVVFISNHMSTMETMIFPCIINPIKESTFVVKDSLVNHPLFKEIMLSRKPIVVSRSNSRADLLKVLTEGPDILRSGRSIIIFPQSTRSIDFIPEKFNSLGIKLALKAGCSVIPVAIKTDFWAEGKIIKDLGYFKTDEAVFISFGPSLKPSGNGKKDHQEVIEFIRQKTDSWKKG